MSTFREEINPRRPGPGQLTNQREIFNLSSGDRKTDLGTSALGVSGVTNYVSGAETRHRVTASHFLGAGCDIVMSNCSSSFKVY